MSEPELLAQIREGLKRTVLLLLEQLRRDHPLDRFYAVLFEVDVTETYAIRVAGSEESLNRLAQKYVAKGYQVESGNLLEALRATLRWDAPGDDLAGWYWGNQDEDGPVTSLIEQAVRAGVICEYDESQPLRRLCLEALRELDGDSAFGSGSEREKLVIGATNCEIEFGEAEHIEELATVNPPNVINRLLRELRAAKKAEILLVHPKR